MVSRRTMVCVECRVARKGYSASCGVEGHEMRDVGTKFRAPRKSDTKAWKRIENGDWWTEDSVTDIRYREEQNYYRRLRLVYSLEKGWHIAENPWKIRNRKRKGQPDSISV